jgi:hypothetical protein
MKLLQYGTYFSPVACELLLWNLGNNKVVDRIETRYREAHRISLDYFTVLNRKNQPAGKNVKFLIWLNAMRGER